MQSQLPAKDYIRPKYKLSTLSHIKRGRPNLLVITKEMNLDTVAFKCWRGVSIPLTYSMISASKYSKTSHEVKLWRSSSSLSYRRSPPMPGNGS